MKIGRTNGGDKIQGTKNGRDFFVSYVQVPPEGGTAGDPYPVYDANVVPVTGGSAFGDIDLFCSFQGGNGYEDIAQEFTLDTTAIATLSGNRITALGSGTITGTGRLPYVGARKYSFPIQYDISGISYQWDSWRVGSLAKHLYDYALSVVASKTPSATTMRRYNPTDFSTSFTPNISCILSGVDLSAIHAPIGTENNSGQNIAISPRHLLVCNHSGLAEGQVVKFVGTDGIVYTRTVTSGYAHRTIYTDGGDTVDFRVVYLDADLPSQVSKMKVAPDNLFTNYLKNVPYGIPIFCSSAHGAEIHIGEIYVSDSGYFNEHPPLVRQSVYQELDEWWQSWGASSSVWFMVVNSEPVYIATNHFSLGSSYGGPFVGAWVDKINAAMTSLSTDFSGTNYQLQIADLSGFTSY